MRYTEQQCMYNKRRKKRKSNEQDRQKSRRCALLFLKYEQIFERRERYRKPKSIVKQCLCSMIV